MLKTLTIQNLATIERLTVDFASGLNALTGETGAGKSILVGGLELALGDRASSEAIRAGESFAVAEATFSGPLPAPVAALLDELEIDPPPRDSPNSDGLVLRRELARSGRNRCFIGERMVGVADLKRLGELLVDLHGQHEHQSLFHAAAHRAALDAAAGHDSLLADYRRAWVETAALRRRQTELEEAARDFERQRDYLDYQLDEIDKVDPKAGEMAALEQEERRLGRAEALAAAAAEAFALLYEGAGEERPPLLSQLAEAARHVGEVAEVEAEFADAMGRIEEAKSTIEDLAFALRDYADRTQADPERLEAVITRLESIRRLARKHGGSEPALLAAWEAMRAQRAQMARDDTERREIGARLAEVESKLRALGERLSRSRRKAAEKMQREVVALLRELAMEKARFEVLVEPLPEPGPEGLDRVEFLLAANPGLPPAPLRKVASGGELSRVMLALKSALAARDAIATLVFDEIDAGISGETARRVGRVMEKLSATHQILCITHHAAIAARAAAHAAVQKTIRQDTTYTQVTPLADAPRLDELARMMGGALATPATRDLARQLME